MLKAFQEYVKPIKIESSFYSINLFVTSGVSVTFFTVLVIADHNLSLSIFVSFSGSLKLLEGNFTTVPKLYPKIVSIKRFYGL